MRRGRWKGAMPGRNQLVKELGVSGRTVELALQLLEAFLFHAAKEHLAQRGILAPRDVSLICVDGDPTFDWCEPSLAHIRWDSRPLVQRIVRWVDNLARGKEDLRQTLTKAVFVDGGMVGPAPEAG